MSATLPGHSGGTSRPGRRRLSVLWFALFLLTALATHGSGLYQVMHCDYSIRLRVARDWAGGKALYRETYDNTQPVVYLWMRLVDSQRPAVSTFLAESLLAAVACGVLRAALLRVSPSASSAIPLLLIAWSGLGDTFYGGQITEGPALWFDVLGVSCFWLALKSDRIALAFIAGACYAIMVGFRIPSAAHLVAWLPLFWVGGVSYRRIWHAAFLASLGVATSGAALFLHAWFNGYWQDYLVVFGRNIGYGSLDRVPFSHSVLEAIKAMLRILLHSPVSGVLLVVGAAVLMLVGTSLRRGEKLWLFVGGLWLIAAIAGAFPGGRHYAHYYHLVWPSVALLGGLWISPLRRLAMAGSSRRVRVDSKLALATAAAPPTRRMAISAAPLVDRLVCGLVVGVIVMGVVSHVYAAARSMRDQQQGVHPWNALSEASRFLDEATSTDTPVLVNAWGDWAELYWRTPRPASSLVIPHVVPRDRYGEWSEVTRGALPEWIVTDGTPWEPIDGPPDAAADASRAALVTAIERDYNEVWRKGELRILRRSVP